jgi:hypothetical protein
MEIWRLRLATGQLLQVSDEQGRAYLPRVSADGRFVGFLETAGFGPWDATSLRLIATDRPFASTLLASGLFDAGELQWQGSRLRLQARSGDRSERQEQVFVTAAADLAVETPAGAIEPELADENWPRYTAAAADTPYVIQAGRIFDGIGDSYDYLVDIHIEGQRITDVVRRGLLPLPARVIAADELTVLPGLIDVHAHISTVAGALAGRQLLGHGVTTVRAVLADTPAATELAEFWDAGIQPGPRLLIDTADTARVSRPLAHSLAEQLSREDRGGAPPPAVLAVRQTEPLPSLIVSTLGRSYQDVIGSLDASGRWLPTGLAATALADRRSPLPDLSGTIARVMRSSGRVAIGSDAPAVPYGRGFHEELALLASRGIPADQILRAATAGGAIALGLSVDAGTIEPGRLADLVIVDGDPLAAIGELQQIVAVVRGGRWFDLAAIRPID